MPMSPPVTPLIYIFCFIANLPPAVTLSVPPHNTSTASTTPSSQSSNCRSNSPVVGNLLATWQLGNPFFRCPVLHHTLCATNPSAHLFFCWLPACTSLSLHWWVDNSAQRDDWLLHNHRTATATAARNCLHARRGRSWRDKIHCLFTVNTTWTYSCLSLDNTWF
jgi:hypothetical protein